MQSLKKKISKSAVSRESSQSDLTADLGDSATEATRRKLATMFFRADKKNKQRPVEEQHANDPHFSFPPQDPSADVDDSSSHGTSREISSRGRGSAKVKVMSLGKMRQRAFRKQSMDESPHSQSHSGTPSISTLASAALKPFPLIRSQSSLSGSPTRPRRSEDFRPRRKTDGEAMFGDSESDRRLTGSSDGRKTKSIPPSRTPSTYLMPREETDLPLPPHGDETVAQYLDLLQELGFGPTICSRLSYENDEFLLECLYDYMNKFSFVDEPIDMSLRKLLMFQRLPRESQQIERVLQAFSATYHDQNPTLFENADQVYFIVFSMMILHTDTFNKNVKHKMSKSSYMRSGYCEGVPLEVLDYIYDNITYTQFIHTDDDNVLNQLFDTPGTPYDLQAAGASTASITSSTTNPTRRTSFGWTKDLFDPYMLILEGRLATLRPSSLVKVLSAHDPYVSGCLASPTEILGLRNRFGNGPTIQLVSERSRPDAYTSVSNNSVSELKTEELLLLASPGVVDIKVVKMGIIERRESSKKMLYSPRSIWREWGAILTESQLYLFKNVAWVRSLIAESSASADPAAAVTRTSLEGFNATMVLSTKDMAALQYESHSNEEDKPIFLLRGSGGMHTWLSASDEEEILDWVRCINFAATFSTHPVPLVPTQNGTREICTHPSHAPVQNGSGNGFYRSASDTSLMSAASLSAQRARSRELLRQIGDLDQKLLTLQSEIISHERDCRHLLTLAPIQQKTRDALVFAAGQYASKGDWQWIDRARYQSYRNVLEMDLRLTETRWRDFSKPFGLGNETMSGVKEESASLSTMSAGSEKFSHEKHDTRLNGTPLDEVLIEDSSQEFVDGSLVREKEAFEVRGHRFSLVDVNPEILGKTRSNPDRAHSECSIEE